MREEVEAFSIACAIFTRQRSGVRISPGPSGFSESQHGGFSSVWSLDSRSELLLGCTTWEAAESKDIAIVANEKAADILKIYKVAPINADILKDMETIVKKADDTVKASL
ncbi:hypothetical protein HNV12_16545 [Methanococcoides sp. SA1]|nr:hypothetical protein [Methanococcoides sp. SA1]